MHRSISLGDKRWDPESRAFACACNANNLTLFVPVTRQRTRILASADFNTKSRAHGFDLES